MITKVSTNKMRLTISQLALSSTLLLSGIASVAHADWYFRGTPNNWGATALTVATATTMETCQAFAGGDAGGNPRFKIDRLGTWSESYPAVDYEVSANKSYNITFYTNTKTIYAQTVNNCSSKLSEVFPSLYFRGTANNWAATPMVLVANNTWQVTVKLDGQANQRFKFDVKGDWSENYGDNNNDKYLDQAGADILQAGVGNYQITVNDATKLFSVVCLDCTSSKASIASSKASVVSSSLGSSKISSSIASSSVASTSVASSSIASSSATTFSKVFPSLNFRGTANSWGSTPMVLVGNNTWQVTVNFDGQANQRFKFDVLGDWAQNYGDNNNDFVAEQDGADIYQAGTGSFKITINDSTKIYKIEIPPCVSGCGTAVPMLGAIYSPASTVFSLWSPDSSNVSVKVKGVVYTMKKVATDFNGYTNVYQATVAGDLRLAEYNFVVNGTDVRDPYAKMAKPQTNSSIVMDMSQTTLAGGWAARPAEVAREDSVVYEVHVRDFTIDSSSGVDASKRGKFMGMVQAGTTFNGVKTSIDHLKELGVTHVQLLPVYDYHSCDGLPDSDPCYNWGYDPRNFNVPEDRYSQTPQDYENRAREFKTMVNEFHKAGIRVIMDVVYNHTHSIDMFNPITNKYYTATDLSGCCGNSVNADQPMVSRFIQDSMEYWLQEYGIDGFRFDLMGVFSYAEGEKWQQYLNAKFADRNLLIYGEPWTGASDPDEAKHIRFGTVHNMQHVGVFNGKYRDALKGDNDGTAKGYLFNTIVANDSAEITDGMRGSPYNANDSRNAVWFRNFAADPEQTINYVSVHDNLNLWDKVYLTLSSNVVQSGHQVQSLTPPADLAYAKRVVNFGMGIVLTSQGIPVFNAGDEFLRSKTNNGQSNLASAWNFGGDGGAANSYSSPDSFNAIKWGNKVSNAATFKYFKDMIAFRRSHAGLRMNTNTEIAQYLILGNPANFNGEVITANIINPKDSADMFVVYNSGANRFVNLPAGIWTQSANSVGAANVTGLSATALVEGTAVTVFTKLH